MRSLSTASHLVATLVVLWACADDPGASDLFADGGRPNGAGDAPGVEGGRGGFGGNGTSGALAGGLGGSGSSLGGALSTGKGGASAGSAQGGSSVEPGASGSNEGGADAAGSSSISGAGGSGRAGASGSAGASPTGGNAGVAGSGNGGAGAWSGGPGTGGSSAGSAGSSGKGDPADCLKLRTQVEELLAEAQLCTPEGRGEEGWRSCSGVVEDQCGCKVVVNDSDSPATKRYADAVARLTEHCTVACAAVLCRDPSTAVCSSAVIGQLRCVAR